MHVSVTANQTMRFNLDTLPATRIDTGSRTIGIFLIAFSLLWGGFPTLAFIHGLRTGPFRPEMLFTLIFTVIGSLILLMGLKLMTSRSEVTITSNSVSLNKRSIFGRTAWTIPLTDYQGVLSRTEHHSGGKNRASYTLYIVDLHHQNPRHTIRIYQSRREDDLRAEWERASRALSLPALQKDGAGDIVKRDVQDLDRPVRDLVREGRVPVNFDPAHPPAGLAFRADGPTLELTLSRQAKWAPIPFMLLLPGVFIYLGFFVKSAPIVFGFVGLLIAAAMLAFFVWSWIARPQLRISRSSICSRHTTPWGPTPGRTLPAPSIEMVRVGRPRNNTPPAVLIESDAATLAFGTGLSPQAMEWIKNCILHVLAS